MRINYLILITRIFTVFKRCRLEKNQIRQDPLLNSQEIFCSLKIIISNAKIQSLLFLLRVDYRDNIPLLSFWMHILRTSSVGAAWESSYGYDLWIILYSQNFCRQKTLSSSMFLYEEHFLSKVLRCLQLKRNTHSNKVTLKSSQFHGSPKK